MSDFLKEIQQVASLITNKRYPKSEEEIQQPYKEILFDYSEYTLFQTAFLALLSEKYTKEIFPKVAEAAKERFINFFNDGRTEQFIRLQYLELPEEGSEEWTLCYENEDAFGPISHVDMKGWEMVGTALSG
ncbi:hypothetical protein [Flammeovirga pacifica]|uniref:Uncharacterized protein n=1 Tax=Flammeovirga pacifica TaxID=915059 RepID=A0A1S1Z2N9_FLAPC|nr:hypothetical protein [Flammeovirga pacifica]OHX67502.1 hypothetical protein NH26_14675 [Flammeovirga pacifica]